MKQIIIHVWIFSSLILQSCLSYKFNKEETYSQLSLFAFYAFINFLHISQRFCFFRPRRGPGFRRDAVFRLAGALLRVRLRLLLTTVDLRTLIRLVLRFWEATRLFERDLRAVLRGRDLRVTLRDRDLRVLRGRNGFNVCIAAQNAQ